MQPIPETTSDFQKLRTNGQLYVDKTRYFHQLITYPSADYFFISRPRRFGKSLMITTLKYIFQGKRELFDGLDISRIDYDWRVHPVIHLNMGFCASANYDQFGKALPKEIERGLKEVGCGYDPAFPCSQIPDEEVRRDLATLMTSLIGNDSVSWASNLGGYLLNFSWEPFFKGLKALYAGVAYGPKEPRVCEYSYCRCLTFLIQGQGVICSQEVTQADGRVDLVGSHPCGIYIFELKVGKTAAIAMEQIQRKNYAAPFEADSRPIWLIGLSFDSATRQLVDTAVECYRQ